MNQDFRPFLSGRCGLFSATVVSLMVLVTDPGCRVLEFTAPTLLATKDRSERYQVPETLWRRWPGDEPTAANSQSASAQTPPPPGESAAAKEPAELAASSGAGSSSESFSPREIRELLTATRETKHPDGTIHREQVDGWYCAPVPFQEDEVSTNNREEAYRWRHHALETLLARPMERRPDLRLVIDDDDRLVAATTVIGLARSGKGQYNQRLAGIARNASLPLSLQQAAIETLSRVPQPSPLPVLNELYGELGRFTGQSRGHYIPELHKELLLGLSLHVDPCRDPRFSASLDSPAIDVRVAVLEIWAQHPDNLLPPEVAELISLGDPRVRVAALKAAAAHGQNALLPAVVHACDDFQLEVKQAALAALGKFEAPEAHQALVRRLSGQPERIRETAVSALAQRGDVSTLLAAVGDESWRVRREVAEALASCSTMEAAVAAAQLVEDRSGEVQLRAVQSLAEWPWELAGPILLKAIGTGDYRTRRSAAKALAEHWPPAGDFPHEADPHRRAGALAELQRRWQAEFGTTAPTVVKSSSRNDHAENLPLIDIVEKLDSNDRDERRAAARQLAETARDQRWEPVALTRLAELAIAESDPLVWIDLIEAVADEEAEPTSRLVYAALTHPSPEVRRRACAYFEHHGAPRHAEMLEGALEDPDIAVVKAAARALGNCGPLAEPLALKRLLAARDGELRVAAATSLIKLEITGGLAALERLAFHDEEEVQRMAAAAMGDLADQRFIPTLIGMLEGRPSVQLAALAALPKVAGLDVTLDAEMAPVTALDKARLWQTWHARQGAKTLR